MESRFVTFVTAAAVFMIALLLLDRDGLAQQLALGSATALFLWFFARSSQVQARQIVCCVIVATIGEVVLSIGWGLYSYRHAVIPLYVPPGHGLFYTLAAETARQQIVRVRGAMITRSVVIAGSVLAVASLALKHDVWGFLWWLGAVALIAVSKNRLLLSACFVYTIILEFVGTAIGNWRWTPEVPFLGLHSANPPSGVGILYILLDLIVVAITSKVWFDMGEQCRADTILDPAATPTSTPNPRIYCAVTCSAIPSAPMKRALFALLSLAVAVSAFAAWHVSRHIPIGGTGGWDYVSIDPISRRAYVSHGDRVEVVDIDAGKVVGLIPDTLGVHGIAIDHDGGRGFISSGRVSMMSIFDLKTLNRINDVKTTGDNPDAILFEPSTKHVFTFNGRGKNATVFDTHGKVIATIDLGGKPEFGVSDLHGTVFVNIEDTSEIAAIDVKTNTVKTRWKLAPCESPSGLAIDRKHHRLFTVCENEIMAVVDSTNGHIVTTVPTGKGTDAATFDDERQLAFASNGQSATLTVVHEVSPDKYDVVDNAATQRSARTMALDTKTHHIFLPAAKFGDAPAATEKNPRPRPPVVPGSFELLEVAP